MIDQYNDEKEREAFKKELEEAGFNKRQATVISDSLKTIEGYSAEGIFEYACSKCTTTTIYTDANADIEDLLDGVEILDRSETIRGDTLIL